MAKIKSHKDRTYRVIEHRNIFFIASGAVIVIGILFMLINLGMGRGLFAMDVEFSGGTSWQVNVKQDFDPKDISQMVTTATGQADAVVQKSSSQSAPHMVNIKMKSIDNDQAAALKKAIEDKYNTTAAAVADTTLQITDTDIQTSTVSATISNEMVRAALEAVIVSCILMLIYIAFRFRDVRLGASCVLALIHDALIMLAAYAILRIPLNGSFIAAILTVIGYSTISSVVMFDRIRENRKLDPKANLAELANLSIRETMTRTLYTTIATLFSIIVLAVIGVQSVRQFCIPIIIGVACGAYSSICIASSLWWLFSRNSKRVVTTVENSRFVRTQKKSAN